MNIQLLLAHPKQKDSNNKVKQMVIYEFQLERSTSDIGSGNFSDLDLLANAAVDGRALSETLSLPETSDSFSASSNHHHDISGPEEVGIKPKRKRASARQLEMLKNTFKQTPFPSFEVRKQLARKLGMTPRSVQIWFQNQRQLARNVVPVSDNF